jgi:hypothetical protein
MHPNRCRRLALHGLVAAALLGCTLTPDLSQYKAQWAEEDVWVPLLPSEKVAAITASQDVTNFDTTQTLAERVATMSDRAASLAARPVLSTAERRRLIAAIARRAS